MKKLLLILLCLLFLASCSRAYHLTFNYYVGNNGQTETEIKTIDDNVNVVTIPQGSGNLTVYIQAEVPKTVDVATDISPNLPLIK